MYLLNYSKYGYNPTTIAFYDLINYKCRNCSLATEYFQQISMDK